MAGLLTVPRRVPVFYSFHFDKDVMRVQQIRNIGAIEDNEPVSKNQWEEVKQKGDAAIENWIDDNMKYRRCIIVLIGSETASRRWVRREIVKAWNDHRGVFGIYIHNVKCPRGGTCAKGDNPFAKISMESGNGTLAGHLTCHEPGMFAYSTIKDCMQGWVDDAIAEAKARWA